MKKNNKKGFTLAELLIVVAIIAVLVAIAIPVFTTQLEKSREATDMANVRSAYAAIVTGWLDNGSANSVTVEAQQKVAGWQTSPQPYLEIMDGTSISKKTFNAVVGGVYTVAITAAGVVTVNGE